MAKKKALAKKKTMKAVKGGTPPVLFGRIVTIEPERKTTPAMESWTVWMYGEECGWSAEEDFDNLKAAEREAKDAVEECGSMVVAAAVIDNSIPPINYMFVENQGCGDC